MLLAALLAHFSEPPLSDNLPYILLTSSDLNKARQCFPHFDFLGFSLTCLRGVHLEGTVDFGGVDSAQMLRQITRSPKHLEAQVALLKVLLFLRALDSVTI